MPHASEAREQPFLIRQNTASASIQPKIPSLIDVHEVHTQIITVQPSIVLALLGFLGLRLWLVLSNCAQGFPKAFLQFIRTEFARGLTRRQPRRDQCGIKPDARLFRGSVQPSSDMQETTSHAAGGGIRHTLERDVEITSTQLKIAKMQISFDNEAFLVIFMLV